MKFSRGGFKLKTLAASIALAATTSAHAINLYDQGGTTHGLSMV